MIELLGYLVSGTVLWLLPFAVQLVLQPIDSDILSRRYMGGRNEWEFSSDLQAGITNWNAVNMRRRN